MIDARMLRSSARDLPKTGMAAIPDAWIPSGTHRARVDTTYGSDYATITRGPDEVRVDCDTAVSPDVIISEVDDQRVHVLVDLPFPLPNLEAQGPLSRDGDVAHLTDETSHRSADMWRTYDGRVFIQIHQPGHRDVDVIIGYTSQPA